MKYISLVILLFALTACSTHQGNFTILSNRLVDTKNFDLKMAQKNKNIEGEDIKHIIVFFPTGVPSLGDAINDACRKNDVDLMTDVGVYQTMWWIPYIYGQNGWKIQGDGIKTRSN